MEILSSTHRASRTMTTRPVVPILVSWIMRQLAAVDHGGAVEGDDAAARSSTRATRSPGSEKSTSIATQVRVQSSTTDSNIRVDLFG